MISEQTTLPVMIFLLIWTDVNWYWLLVIRNVGGLNTCLAAWGGVNFSVHMNSPSPLSQDYLVALRCYQTWLCISTSPLLTHAVGGGARSRVMLPLVGGSACNSMRPPEAGRKPSTRRLQSEQGWQGAPRRPQFSLIKMKTFVCTCSSMSDCETSQK